MKQRSRCGPRLKADRRTCVAAFTPVQVTLSDSLSWDLGYAAQALLKRPQAIREAVEAAHDILDEGEA